MRRNAVLCAVTFLAAVSLAATRASAQGFSVYEHDACAMGRSGTGVASPCSGGSAAFFNPAGLVGGSARWNASLGVTMIAPRGSFTDSITGDETFLTENNIPVPSFYVSRQLNSRWAVGLGVNAPYGLTTEWPSEFSGRFLAYKSMVKSIYIQPTVAVEVEPRLSVGAGVDIVRSSVELHQRADLSEQSAAAGLTFAMLGVPVGTDFADATLNATGWGVGAHFGLLFRATDWLSVGARYLTQVTIDYDGDATFSQVPTGITLAAGNPLSMPAGTPLDALLASKFLADSLLGPQTAEATIPMPAQFVVGVAVRVLPSLRILADYQFTNWKAFEALPLNIEKVGRDTLYEDYRNTNGWRGAIEFTPTSRLTLRGGMLTHSAAAPTQTVTPLLPEGERIEGTAGASLQLTPRLRLDAAYQYIRQQDRRGRVVDSPVRGIEGARVNSGLYRFTAKLFGAGVAFAF